MELAIEELCVACGYDLRGHRDEGVCPECGLAVSMSRYRQGAGPFDRSWLKKLRNGTRLLFFSQLALASAFIISRLDDQFHFVRFAFFLYLFPIAMVVASVSMWMMSAPALQFRIEPWWNWIRIAMRLVCAAPAAASLLLFVNHYRPALIQILVVEGLIAAGWIPCIAVTFCYLSGVCDAMRKRSLARASRLAMWTLPLGMIAPPAVAAITMLSNRNISPGPILIGIASVLGAWLLGSYCLGMYVLYRIAQTDSDRTDRR